MEPDYSIPLAIPFSVLNTIIPLPDKRPFPQKVQTVGDHIHYARLERKVLIKDVIAQLNIDRETLRGWEKNITIPSVQHAPLIIKFLGYNPYTFDTTTLAGKIKHYRYTHGLTLRQFAHLLQTNVTTIWQWESKGRVPLEASLKKILTVIESE